MTTADTLAQQLTSAWTTHNNIMLYLLDKLPEDAFAATLSKRGGRTVAEQLAHLHNIRLQWTEAFRKKSTHAVAAIGKDTKPDKPILTEAFNASGELIKDYLSAGIENGGKASGFKGGVVAFMSYLIAHEAHHRGNIMLTLKQCNVKLPDELKWAMWDWNKMMSSKPKQ